MKTLNNFYLTFFALILGSTGAFAQATNLRMVQLLDNDWKFINSEVKDGESPQLNTSQWQTVEVPHDWAISGPFAETNDMQVVQVIEDNEKVAKKRSGRTGGLPHVGIGWYRKNLEIPSAWKGKRIFAEFDGAMSHAKVYLNGQFVGEWPYGYASFGFELTDKIIFGKNNVLAVRLENKPNSSRWYPGAGIYRNVRLVVTNPVCVKQWGTYITTPGIEKGDGTIKIETSLDGALGSTKNIRLITNIYDRQNKLVVSSTEPVKGNNIFQQIKVNQPHLWSVTDPYLYKAESIIEVDGKKSDRYETVFGFRYFKFTNNKGFFPQWPEF